MKPYTYLIGWKQLNRFYYGVRYAKNCEPSELMVSYFTSSKLVRQYLSDYGYPDIVEIRRIFNTVNEARDWEHRVLRRLKVTRSSLWLNKTDNRSIQPMPGKLNSMYGRTGQKHHRYGAKLSDETKKKIGDKSSKQIVTEEFRKRMSEITKGRNHSQETKRKISNALKGRVFSENHKKNIGLNHADNSGEKNPFYGKNHSKEVRDKMSEMRRGKRWVHNPLTKNRKLVYPFEVDDMLLLGYNLGKGNW